MDDADSRYGWRLFYATLFSTGRKAPSGCWLPDKLQSAYQSTHNAALAPPPKLDFGLWFPGSEIPIQDAKSVDLADKNYGKRITACHHPFLCEISESDEEKQKHAPHSHICVRLSHLVLAPQRVNSRHLELQRAAAAVGVSAEKAPDARFDIINTNVKEPGFKVKRL